MKTKNLAIIFILFLLITLGSGLAVFLTGEKEQPILNQADKIINSSVQPAVEKKSGEAVKDRPVPETANEAKPVIRPEKIAPPEIIDQPTEEKIQAAIVINGTEYRISVEPKASVYDLMKALKEQKKIDFQGKNYSDLGFFVEEINGVRNNPAGENWVYYINGQPAPVGVSYYNLKNNDIIEWKYEKKSF